MYMYMYMNDRRFHNTDAHMRVFAINESFTTLFPVKYTYLQLIGLDIVDDIFIETQ